MGKRPGRTPYADQQTHRSIQRAEQVLELRVKRGWTWRRIGTELGLTHSHCRQLYLKYIERAQADLTKEARSAVIVELRRLDELWDLNFERATDKNREVVEQQAATEKCLKISEQRRKLLGLDAPERLELTGADGGPIMFQSVQELSGEELDKELAGFYNPGFMEGAADGYERGFIDGKREGIKEAGGKKPAKKKAEKKDDVVVVAEAEQAPKPKRPVRGSGDAAKTEQAVVTAVAAPVSQGRARV